MSDYKPKAKAELMKFEDFKNRGGDWPQYKQYLASNGALSAELTMTLGDKMEIPAPKKREAVPWSCMTFREVEEKGMLGEVDRHCIEVLTPEKAKIYTKFLVDKAGYPRDWRNYILDNLKK